MQVSVTEAQDQLGELVSRVEAGEEVLLTQHGRATVRLVAVTAPTGREERLRVLAAVRADATSATPGPSAARSQDFLYGPDGLPE